MHKCPYTNYDYSPVYRCGMAGMYTIWQNVVALMKRRAASTQLLYCTAESEAVPHTDFYQISSLYNGIFGLANSNLILAWSVRQSVKFIYTFFYSQVSRINKTEKDLYHKF